MGYQLEKQSGQQEQFADSIYYLGFLFTLISLAAALFYLSGPELDLAHLVSKFGLALATTILGLAIRVALVNFAPTARESQLAAEEELRRAVDGFRQEVELVTDKLQVMLWGVSDRLDEAAQKAASSIDLTTDQAAEGHRKMLMVMTDAVQDALGDVGHRMKGSLRTLTDSVSSAGQGLRQQTETMSSADGSSTTYYHYPTTMRA